MSAIRFEKDSQNIITLTMDVPDQSANTMNAVFTAALEAVVQRLAALDVEARRHVPGMEPKRADVIVAGGRLALALLEHWSVDAVRISDRGVRWGLAEELSG